MLKADMFRMMDITVWPLVAFLSTALFAAFVTTNKDVLTMIILSTVGWRIVYNFQIEPAHIIMEDTWSGSLEQLFVTPIRTWELLVGGWIIAFIKTIIVALLFVGVSTVLFSFSMPNMNILVLGLLASIIAGMAFSLITLGIAILKGPNSYGFLYALIDAITVVSGVYYPTTVFPWPLHAIAQLLPTTHAFNLLKQAAHIGEASFLYLILTSMLWLIIGTLFCSWAVTRARSTGRLVRMK